MAENISRIKSNIKKMISQGASEAEIDQYVASEGVTLDQLKGQSETKQPLPEQDSGIMRGLGIGARAVLEGASGIPSMIGDAANALVNQATGGINSLFGTNIPQLAPVSSVVSGLLDQSGLPQAQTSEGQLAAALTRGVTGAISPIGAASLAKPVTQLGGDILKSFAAAPGSQALAGGASELSSEAARQGGAGEVGQALAGIAGGGLASIPSLAKQAGQTAKTAAEEIAKPFTVSGQKQIVGRALSSIAEKPRKELVRELRDSQYRLSDFVSDPTTAQAVNDLGLISAEQTLKNTQFGPKFTRMFYQQNEARYKMLDAIAQGPAAIKAKENARSSIALPLLAKAKETGRQVDSSSTINKINRMIATEGKGDPVVRNALEKARAELAPEGFGPLSDVNDIHNFRKFLGRMLEGQLGGDDSASRFASKQILAVRDELDKAINKTGPEFKAFLEKWKQESAPIERLKKLQETRSKVFAQTGPEGEPVISQVSFRNAFKRNQDEFRQLLSPLQFRAMQRISNDLDRGTKSNIKTAVGSDTVKNMTMANFLGRMLGDKFQNSPIAKELSRPLNFLFKFREEEVLEMLSDAMLDPVLAADLLENVSEKTVASIGPKLTQKLNAIARATAESQATGNGQETTEQPKQ